MIPFERQQQLLSILKEEKCATVAHLAHRIYISEASVRRDIAVLEQQGLVHRRYGGVVLAEYDHGVVPLALREGANAVGKEQIAKRAAALVPDGATVMLDASSTAKRMFKYLAGRKNITVITNNTHLTDKCPSGITLYSVGGKLDPDSGALVGPAAERFVRGMRAELLFFSSQGIDGEGNITDASEAESSLRRVMLAQSDKKYFLCDKQKIGVRRTFAVCTKDDVDGILCDDKLPWE